MNSEEQEKFDREHSAKIVAGVRMPQKRRSSEKSCKPSKDDKYEAEEKEAAHEIARQANKDFSANAIRVYHEKPIPNLQKPTQKPTPIVFQPSKQ